jgi:hypothetical protein
MTSRSITGLVLEALLAVPAAAQAQARRSSGGSGVWLGGAFGLETGDHFSGYKLRFEGEVPVARLSPTVQLYGVGAVSYAGLSHDVGVFTLLPAARINWAASREFGAYGDVGLGLYHEWDGDGNTGATMRFLVGGYYEMSPVTRFFVEAGVNPYFGDFGDKTSLTSFTLLLGAKFRI